MLACGGLALVSARGETRVRAVRPGLRLGVLVALLALGAFVFAGLVGTTALDRGVELRDAGLAGPATAEAERAARWLPWSGEPWRVLGEVAVARGDVALARERFRRGLERDPRHWVLWRDLARVTRGDERRRALQRAARLNPLGVRGPRASGEVVEP